MSIYVQKRDNIREVEEGKYLSPKFDKNGLIPVITTDFQTGDILMHSYMNDEALKKQLKLKKLTIGVVQRKNMAQGSSKWLCANSERN